MQADRPLSKVEKFELRFHLFICPYCREYAHQLTTVNKAVNKLKLKDT